MFFRKYWIPLLVFIVAIVGVSLYVLQTRPPRDPILIVKPVEFGKQPAKEPVGDTSQGGHFDSDGTWKPAEPHKEKEPVAPPVDSPAIVRSPSEVSVPVGSTSMPRFHDPSFVIMDGFLITSKFAMSIAPLSVGPDFAAMSAEELAAAVARINSDPLNLPDHLRPPEGYDYIRGGRTVLSDGDNVWLDDNGHPILSKRHTPFYEISWSEGFRPPPDVYADYNTLWELHLWSETPEEGARVRAEMDAIVAKYRGPVPDGAWASGGGSPSYFAQFDWARDQMRRMAFEEAGIAYLMDNYSSLKEFVK